MQPKIAVISAGAVNEYGHPAVQTLNALARQPTRMYRTDIDGTVTVTTDGTRVQVATGRGNRDNGFAMTTRTTAVFVDAIEGGRARMPLGETAFELRCALPPDDGEAGSSTPPSSCRPRPSRWTPAKMGSDHPGGPIRPRRAWATLPATICL